MKILTLNPLTEAARNFKKKNHTHQGRLGEELALKFLLQKGYLLRARNYYIRGGEIDLIMQKDGILIFVEVKMRRNTMFGPPEEALNQPKKQKLLAAIYHFLSNQKDYMAWRCDLIAILFKSPREAEIKHFIDIFDD